MAETPREFLDGRVVLHPGDCLEVLARLPGSSVDAVVTDPPYHLASIVKRFGGKGAKAAKSNGATGVYARSSRGFMGKQWDGGDVAFRPETWAAVLRVLKPGGNLLAFAAPKNVHWLAGAIEAAGFEMRDRLIELVAADAAVARFMATLTEEQIEAFLRCLDDSAFGGELAWVFGSGFPKSHNLTGEWSGWGTALKPAYEPIVWARKPLAEASVAANVLRHGAGAVNIDGCKIEGADVPEGRTRHGGGVPGNGTSYELPDSRLPMTARRWPANVLHDGSADAVEGFPDTTSGQPGIKHGGNSGAAYGAESRPPGTQMGGFGDFGSAARFFYTAKADSDDRLGSRHPTVKPLDLMQWLVRFACRKGGVVLDPFAGTGTTGEAAFREGCRAVLIEREAEYQTDIARRMDLATAGPETRRMQAQAARGPAADEIGGLFGGK